MANHSSYSSTRSDIGPDPYSSLVGAENLSLRKNASPAVREVPEIRKKNKHLDEIYKLKQEVSDLQDMNDGLHVSMRRMALDMNKAEKQLKTETDEHAKKQKLVQSLQQELLQLSAELEQSKTRTGTGRASSDLEEARTAEVARLTTALQEKDNQLLEKSQELAKAQTSIMSTSSAMEDQSAKLSAQLKKEIQLRENAQQDLASLQQQATTTAAGEVDELRTQCAFYQKHSEQLSKRLMARDSSDPRGSSLFAESGSRSEMAPQLRGRMPGHF